MAVMAATEVMAVEPATAEIEAKAALQLMRTKCRQSIK